MSRRSSNQLRIIGGTWRSRRIAFPNVAGLRPSPDRVRETLFNWLAPIIEGSCCLDLYAGSGALGMEALSRGAASVTFVDADHLVIQQLQTNLKQLGATQAKVELRDVPTFLQGPPQAYDIVFLDPPFRQNLLPDCLARLSHGWLAAGARIYVESEAELELVLPEGWEILRSKQAGQLRYSLLTWQKI